MDKSTYYQLNLPTATDPADISKLTENFTKIDTALHGKLSTPITSDIDLNGHRIKNIGQAQSSEDVATVGDVSVAVQQVSDAALFKSGGTMTGNIAMGGNKVTGLPTPTDATDAVNKEYVDGKNWSRLVDYTQETDVADLNLIKFELADIFKCKQVRLWIDIPYSASVAGNAMSLTVQIGDENLGLYTANLCYQISNIASPGSTGTYHFSMFVNIFENTTVYDVYSSYISKVTAYEGANTNHGVNSTLNTIQKQRVNIRTPYIRFLLNGKTFDAGTRIIVEGL